MNFKQRPITEVESTNQVIFNYVRERLIKGNEIIYKKDLLDTYNNRLPLEVEPVPDVRPIIEKIKNSKTFFPINQPM